MASEALKKSLQPIKGLTKQEIIAKMQSGEFIPPSRDQEQDRAEFFSFVGMSAEERDKYLAGDEPPKPTAGGQEGKPEEPPPSPEGTPSGEPPAAAAEPPKPAETPAGGEPPKHNDPWFKELGHESEEKAKEAYRNLLVVSSNLQDQINNLNAKEGKRGQELRRLKEENDALLKKLGAAAPSAELKRPVRPKRPNPAEFENGSFDEKYIEAVNKFDSDLTVYEEQLESYQQETVSRTVAERLKQVAPSPTEPDKWEKMFNVDIPTFQKKYKLETTVPVRQISDNYSIISPSNTTATPQEKAIAKAFIEGLPQTDLDNYLMVRAAVEKVYDFTSGMPESAYRTIEGGLADIGMLDQYIPRTQPQPQSPKPVPLSKAEEEEARRSEREKNGSSATPIPGSGLASGDSQITKPQGVDEQKEEYRSLLSEYNRALQSPKTRLAFEQTDKFRRLVKLKTDLGIKSHVIV